MITKRIRGNRRELVWCLIVLKLAGAGCAMPRNGIVLSPKLAPESERRRQLRAALNSYRDLFETSVDSASRQFVEESTRATVRKAAIEWRSRMVDVNDSAVARPDEFVALLDAWGIALRMHDYLATGEGRRLFAERQDAAVKVSSTLVAAVDGMATQAMPADQAISVRKQVTEYAGKHPIKGVFILGEAPPFTLDVVGNQALAGILQLPLLPFTALGQVGGGVGKALDLPSAVDRFSQAVRALPEDARWQLESVLTDLQSGPAADSALSSFEQLSQSSARLSATAEQLPVRVREELETLLTRSDVPHERLRAILADARQTVSEVDAALASAKRTNEDVRVTVDSVTNAVPHLERTANAIGAAARDITVMITPRPKPEQSNGGQNGAPASATSGRQAPPFDINDWTRTADAMTRTIVELRGAIADLNGAMAAGAFARPLGELSALTQSATDHAKLQAEHLANQMTWRGAGLIVLAFGLAMAYRRWGVKR